MAAYVLSLTFLGADNRTLYPGSDPGGAIAVDADLAIDVSKCIFCCACIKTCPQEAVSIDAPLLVEKRQWLHENCAGRKEPEFYF